jgi:hypothetical protein
MADNLFNPGREGFLAAEIDWNSAVIRVALVRGYTYSASHKFVSEIVTAGATLVATSNLTNCAVANGIADADDVVFSAVPTGTACNALIIYQASAVGGGGDVATSAQRLIADIRDATGLPVTPNGGNINVAWDNGSNKIFNL